MLDLDADLGTYLAVSTIFAALQILSGRRLTIHFSRFVIGGSSRSQFDIRKNELQKLFRHLTDSAGQ